jgi:hypothetical protein
MMRIENFKSNQTLVHGTAFTALLSYGVPQVIVMYADSAMPGTVLHNSAYYSNNTSKHKNAYMRTLCPDSYTFIPASPAEMQEVSGLECRDA